MTEDRKRQTLTPSRLRDVLDRLNLVLDEAARLRDELTRRLEEQRVSAQQVLSAGGQKKKKKA